MIGPPASVAIARDESFALVTGASKIDPADQKKTVPDDKLTVIDLKASPPKVAAQLQDVVFRAPLLDQAARCVRVSFRPAGPGYEVSVDSRPEDPTDDPTPRRSWSVFQGVCRVAQCRWADPPDAPQAR